jgi:hypothetical protein
LTMNLEETRKRYEGLPPLPDSGWDITWVDRLRSWDSFVQKGPVVAANLRALQVCAANYDRDFRDLCKELHDLVLETFPKTQEEEKELQERRSEPPFNA